VVALGGGHVGRHGAPRRLGLRAEAEGWRAQQSRAQHSTGLGRGIPNANCGGSRAASSRKHPTLPQLLQDPHHSQRHARTAALRCQRRTSWRLSGVDQKTGRPQPCAAAMVSTGSRQRSRAPYSSILPIRGSQGMRVRCWPSGVSASSAPAASAPMRRSEVRAAGGGGAVVRCKAGGRCEKFEEQRSVGRYAPMPAGWQPSKN
jgi:hypothetical protein